MQLKTGQRYAMPWGPQSTVNGAKYVPAAKAFIEAVGFGQEFSGKELVDKAREVCPELFETRDRGDLTPGEVADRLNQGGKNGLLVEKQFRLEWFPAQRMYMVIDAAEIVDRRDVARIMERAARNAGKVLTEALQMATHLIKALPLEEQQSWFAQYSKQMHELDIIRNWGEKEQLGLLDAVEDKTGLKLEERNGQAQLTNGKKK
jgi:hypothetical protein